MTNIVDNKSSSFFKSALMGVGRGIAWCFEGVRPLRFLALIFILLVGVALIYVNTLGAWKRTGDIGYTALIFGIEGVVLVALPIVFAVKGWFNTTVALVIFLLGIGIASVNAKPALEEILGRGVTFNPIELEGKALALEDELYGFRNPETGERDVESGLIFQANRLSEDASIARNERGHTTPSVLIDEQAALVRENIAIKQAEVSTLRGNAMEARFNALVSIVSFIVAELIRSFGLKVLVGFDGSGRGRSVEIADGVTLDQDGNYTLAFPDLKSYLDAQRAIDEKKTRLESAKKSGEKGKRRRRREKKQIEAEAWWDERIEAVMAMREASISPVEIAKHFGQTIATFKLSMQERMTAEQFSYLMSQDEGAELNGHDTEAADYSDPELGDHEDDGADDASTGA